MGSEMCIRDSPSPAKDLAMGHEVFGEVVELGENVKDLEIGKKYVVYPWIGCGKCEVCLSGNEHYCGITRDGGYGEYVLVPDKKYLFDAGDTHDDLAGSYACRGLTAYSAIKKANLIEGQKSVVVVGAGGMGLLSIRILKAVYDINPIVVDIDNEKLAIAREAGASAAILSLIHI